MPDERIKIPTRTEQIAADGFEVNVSASHLGPQVYMVAFGAAWQMQAAAYLSESAMDELISALILVRGHVRDAREAACSGCS